MNLGNSNSPKTPRSPSPAASSAQSEWENLSGPDRYVDLVRTLQLETGKPPSGVSRVSEQLRSEIRSFLDSPIGVSAYVPADSKHHGELRNAAEILLTRFEELRRRNSVALGTEEERSKSYQFLLTTLHLNAALLERRPRDLVSCSLMDRTLTAAVITEKEFSVYRDTPWVYRYAAESYPTNPREFLWKALAAERTIARAPEFRPFRSFPGFLRRTAVEHQRSWKKRLKQVASLREEILSETEFLCYQDSPGIVMQAIVNRPADPRALLRKLKRAEAGLMENPEFREALDRAPTLARYAVTRNYADPESELRRVIALYNAQDLTGPAGRLSEGARWFYARNDNRRIPGESRSRRAVRAMHAEQNGAGQGS